MLRTYYTKTQNPEKPKAQEIREVVFPLVKRLIPY